MLRHILQACVDALKTEFGNPDSRIEVGLPGGRPPPFSGQWFITAWSVSHSNQDDRPEGLDESFEVKITLTMKMAWAPSDRQDSFMAEEAEGYYEKAERIKDAIHGNYVLLQNANQRLNYAKGRPTNGMVEPLIYKNTSYADRDPSWVWSDDTEPVHANNIFTAELSFGNGRQVQYLEIDR